jgi:hypothetical protein
MDTTILPRHHFPQPCFFLRMYPPLRVQARNLVAHLDRAAESRREAKLAALPPPVNVGLPLAGATGSKLRAAHALAADLRTSRDHFAIHAVVHKSSAHLR